MNEYDDTFLREVKTKVAEGRTLSSSERALIIQALAEGRQEREEQLAEPIEFQTGSYTMTTDKPLTSWERETLRAKFENAVHEHKLPSFWSEQVHDDNTATLSYHAIDNTKLSKTHITRQVGMNVNHRELTVDMMEDFVNEAKAAGIDTSKPVRIISSPDTIGFHAG